MFSSITRKLYDEMGFFFFVSFLNQPLLRLIPPHSFLSRLSSPRCRCSSCSSSADKASSGSRSGTCLCLIRRRRRSPESWCRRSWPGSPKCAASWSGGTSRSCIRGGKWSWERFVVECFSVAWAIHRAVIHRQSAVRESVIAETMASWRRQERAMILPHYGLVSVPTAGRAGRLLVNPSDPTETLHHCTITQILVCHLNYTV